jgi:Family of unknown function (DUF6535)
MASSLLSAMLAMLLRQWARRYAMAIQQPWLTPDQRARVREIFTNYPHGPHLLWVTGPMVFFLCLSILLYVTGGLVFLFNINLVVFSSGALCAVHGAVLYFCYTVASIFKPEILWYTPFSPLVLSISLRVWDIVLRLASCIPSLRRLCDKSRRLYHVISLRYHEGLLQGKCMAVEEVASKRSSEIDPNVLEWTFSYLVEDPALSDPTLAQFFGAIPGFLDSKLVNNIQCRLSERFQIKFRQALNGFLDHTFSSNTFTESVRGDRFIICLNAARAALGPAAVSQILRDIFDGRWPAALQSIEVGHALKHWDDIQFSSYIRRIVARIVSRVQIGERDDRWIALVHDEFGIPDRAIGDHAPPGDASITILIHIIRQLLRTDSPPWDPDILRGFSDFDICNTLPTQKHDFCTMWNEGVREAQNRGVGSTPVLILKEIRHIHAALHQHEATGDSGPMAYSDSSASDDNILLQPLSYPSCHVVDHRLDSTTGPHLDKVQKGYASHPHHQRHEVPDVTPFPTFTPTPSQPVPLEGRRAAAADNPAISLMANIIPRPTFSGGLAGRTVPEMEPPIPSAGFDFPPTSTLTSVPSLSGGADHSVLPASVDAVVTRADYVLPTTGIPASLSDAARLSVLPHVSTALDQSSTSTLGLGGADTPNDTPDPNPPVAIEVHRRPWKSAPSASDIPANTRRRDSGVQHRTSF